MVVHLGQFLRTCCLGIIIIIISEVEIKRVFIHTIVFIAQKLP